MNLNGETRIIKGKKGLIPKIPGEKIIFPLVTLIVFLTVWHLVAISGKYTPHQLPGPGKVGLAFAEILETGIVWEHIGISMYRLSVAYLLGMVTAIPLGLVFGWYTRAYQAVDPFIQVLRPISPIAWFPLAMLWFKIGNPPAIFIIYLSVVFPILLATVAAVRNVDKTYLKVAVNFGTSEFDILRKVVIPAAFPYITVGLHIALGTGWIHLVAGEMLGAQSGLGYLIVDARNFLRTEMVIVGMLIVGILGLILDKLMTWTENKVKAGWGL
jgi:NitT/TauT family transport system permease protein